MSAPPSVLLQWVQIVSVFISLGSAGLILAILLQRINHKNDEISRLKAELESANRLRAAAVIEDLQRVTAYLDELKRENRELVQAKEIQERDLAEKISQLADNAAETDRLIGQLERTRVEREALVQFEARTHAAAALVSYWKDVQIPLLSPELLKMFRDGLIKPRIVPAPPDEARDE